ncbi:sigma factor [Micromonosporaceae bacterium B7E4]
MRPAPCLTPGREPATVADVERVFRTEYGRAVAVLIRVFGDIDVAEDAVQDAFATAIRSWPADGTPPSPAGWIITTARNRAIDRLRRESTLTDRHTQAALLHATDEPASYPGSGSEEEGPVRDERLRLIFTCCHPALAPAARVALTLRLLGGLSTAEIAHAFLLPETDHGTAAGTRQATPRPPPRRTGLRSSGSYDHLMVLAPSPVVALNRAVALAEVAGPAPALTLVEELDLGTYHVFHAVRADLLRRLGRTAEAALAYDAAAALTRNTVEQDFLRRSRRTLGGTG